ncbi:MAG: choice-of-anchor J domain-containing protein [Candidatus Sumerlaeia bacterium]|nr:choice-of-anchor J domain-containing protein [Candidatus Sumerlaeia bacterium]
MMRKTLYSALVLGLVASAGTSAHAVVYSEDFESLADLSTFVIEDYSGATTWELFTSGGNTVADLFRDPLAPHDDWLITPGFTLTAGNEYTISYWYRGGGNTVDDILDVYIGTTQTSAGMLAGTTLAEYNPLNNSNSPNTAVLSFTPTTTGTHYLGFHGRSDANQNFISIDDILVTDAANPPNAISLAYPADGADNVYKETFLYSSTDIDVDSVTIRLATSETDLDLPASIVVENSSTDFFGDPGTLTPGETYFARVDATNANGTTEGPVTTFTVLPDPSGPGDVYFLETFDAPHQVNTDNTEYPELPKGWDALDVDGAINGSGFASAWYIAVSSRGNTPPNALLSRYNADQTPNDDWVFLPVVETHPTLETEVSFLGRVRSDSFPETVEVRYATVDSTNPADYSNLLDTINNAMNMTLEEYTYTLPANSTVRVALRYTSVFQSQYVVDDVTIRIEGTQEPTSAEDWLLFH